MVKYKIVIVRHGESCWNLENKFCGWHDVDLGDVGISEAHYAGKVLKEAGFQFDLAYTSVLKRAIKTLNIIHDEMDNHWIPVFKSWRLNERQYGDLQGRNKSETAAIYGEDQVKVWRRSYDVRPPSLARSDPRWPGSDPKYKLLDSQVIPTHECLRDVVYRVLPFWHDVIVPSLKSGKRPLLVVHGSTARALIKYIDGVSDEDILNLNVPTGIPLVYELDEGLSPIKHYYLAEDAKVKQAVQKIIDQGKAKRKDPDNNNKVPNLTTPATVN